MKIGWRDRASNRAASMVAAGVMALVGVSSLARAGSLEPPAGPVAPSMKTLVDVEPRIAVNQLPGDAAALHVINRTGSYYLTGNITGVAGKAGIRVDFPIGGDGGVTIDLTGFVLEGVPNSLDGVEAPTSIRIHNGSVVRWGGNGVTITRGIVENLRADSNGGDGIHASNLALVRACTCASNGGDGISGGDNLTVLDCVSSVNDGRGIRADAIAVVRNCVAYNNDAGGIQVLGNSIIESCTLDSNTGPGIEVVAWTRVSGNRILGGTGILATGVENHIENNSVRGTIRATGQKNLVVRNVISGPLPPLDIVPGNLVGPVSSDPTSAGHWDNFVTSP